MIHDYIQTGLLLVVIALLARGQWQPQGRKKNTKKVVLDTCALIDGRVVQLAQNGFIPGELVVPDFVVHELQLLADGADAHKRERARFGLDVVKELQGVTSVTIDRSIQDKVPTDDKLVLLAKKLGAPLYTTDYNLNKVADIQNVEVMNVNELAQNLRPVAIPGEHKQVKLLQKGSNPRQAVGYLEDGTMVVVDNATKYIGKTVEVEVTRTHQTVAGKMMFASLANEQKAPVRKQKSEVSPRAEQLLDKKQSARRPRASRQKPNQY